MGTEEVSENTQEPKRKRGRPRIYPEKTDAEKRKPGRPKGSKAGYSIKPATQKKIALFGAQQGEDDKLGNKVILSMANQLLYLPRVDTNDTEAVKERVGIYFKLCEEYGTMPTVSGLASALKVTTLTLRNWAQGVHRSGTELDVFIKEIYQTLEFIYESHALNSKSNAAVPIFLTKNHFGYKDEQDLVIADNNNVNINDLISNANLLPDDIIDVETKEIEENNSSKT